MEKGAGNAAQTIANFTSKEELKVLNEDIRFIKQNNVTLSPKGDFFFGSLTYWLLYLIPGIAFITFLGIFHFEEWEIEYPTQTENKLPPTLSLNHQRMEGDFQEFQDYDEF